MALGCYTSTNLLRNLLQLCVNQIRSFFLLSSKGEAQLRILSEDLPALQELVISGTDPYCAGFVRSISSLPSTMHSLKILGMRPSLDLGLIDSCSPMWAHLTDVEITICRPSAPTPIMSQAILAHDRHSIQTQTTFGDTHAHRNPDLTPSIPSLS